MNKLTYNSVAEIFEAIDHTRSRLDNLIGSLEDERFGAREHAEGWTIREIVEHLAIVENGMLKIIGRLLRKSEEAGAPFQSDGPIASFAKFADALENTRVKAPDMVAPAGTMSVEDAGGLMKQNRAGLYELKGRLEAVDASSQTFPHPYFGELTAYQWLALIGLHESRHIGQIQRILGEKSN
jgi:uncharacterized damage-inducible protein DinB